MAEEERFIDLADKKRVVLTDRDLTFIKDNPTGLTIEGAKVELYNWLNKSRNRYQQAKFGAMVQRCKSFKKSGKLQNGKTVLSRDEQDNVSWAEWLDTEFKSYSKKQWEELPEQRRL